jgi:hypothetical protein
MSIRDLLNGKRKVEEFADRVKAEETQKGRPLTKEEMRELEVATLKPDRLPPGVFKVKYTTPLKEQTVKLVFGNKEDYDLFCRHFKVLNYKEQNVADLKLLMAILRALEEEVIVYEDGRIKRNES